ncbi:hypothetical protein [Chelativorans sp. AA-79]|uniref:hypothetical protein n=1 Tax=Chelativorans sp. AA-79 TaxID=3028735 RepID=UPI0023F7CDEE|nr:hypothetical protein [Chelativorans sp. AA-79]WEX07358.1 hypothetical protein PVE73_14630 [Chelativorans sp. AA-79]
MNWTDVKLIAAIAGGLLIAFLLSTANTVKARVASVASGLFFAIFLTEPLINWAGLEFSVWQYAVAGLLAMSGDRLARRIMQVVDTGRLPVSGGRS